MRTTLVLCVLWLAFATSSNAQDPSAIESRYVKTEHRIPMRDGTHLFTTVYSPRDTAGRYAIMLARTPYGVGTAGQTAFNPALRMISPRFIDRGFIFVYQDVRGRSMSEGDFVHMTPWRGTAGAKATDESTDAHDTIDWLIRNVPHNNGRVGIWGTSYPGYYAAAALVDAHPALKAASPQAPQADWFMGDDVHHHGAFWLASAFNFFISAGRARPSPGAERPARFQFGTDDGYQFFLAMGPLSNADRLYLKGSAPFWNDMMAHGTLDEFWKARQLAPKLRNVKPAVLTVGGWYDANNLHGALRVHEAIARQSPGTSNRIVLGPWSHGQWRRGGPGDALGELKFGVPTGPFFRDTVEYSFFESHLYGDGSVNLPTATVFETGVNRWRTFDAWPPKTATKQSLYLRAGGKLSFTAPPASESPAYREYESDPAKPVPFLAEPSTGMKSDYMALDQRFGSNRPDVLVYVSDPLPEDVTVAGSMRPTLFVSTSGTDSDWVVKLIDVHPGAASDRPTGFQELVRGDAMRGKFRNSYSRPEAFVPGKVEPVAFNSDDVLHTFRKGHRIMVQVQSSWFPLVDRNPQTFVDIYNAVESDFRAATQRVYHTASHSSRIELPVIP
ncbi:MAG: CocE/NonD family hydrolase [Gemmatimonadales bacterium]